MLSVLFRVPALFILLNLLTAPLRLAAQSSDAYLTRIPDPKRLGETYVSNPDGILAAATVAELNTTLRALDQSGRAHIDVVVAQSIGEAVPKTAATALFNRWKIGDPTKNNGLLMLLVMDQRRVEFETGYGLEADVPDVVCYRIQQRYMVPALRAGQPDEAVRQGVAALIRQLGTGSFEEEAASGVTLGLTEDTAEAGSTDAELYPEAPTSSPLLPVFGTLLIGLAALVLYSTLWYRTTQGHPHREALALVILLPFGLILLAFFSTGGLNGWLLLVVAYLLPGAYLWAYFRRVGRTLIQQYAGRSRHAQYTYLRQAHHGLGFAPYVFPLPLVWYWARHQQQLQALRETPYSCPSCSRPMRRLGEDEEDAFLQAGEQVEEKLRSVDHDVWHCDACQHTLKLNYPDPGTEAQPCPACHYRTLLDAGRQVVTHATYEAGGWGWDMTRCRHCGHEQKTRFTTPRLTRSSSGGSSFSSGSSSSSGGSWSSSSGGSSGGGGAGSSW
ncbi:TPM domain-containing protein [Hymenobacter sp. CRA2]|uniref:TPM domain-containing protein n=1 Tax=Hymenobacter sp. CRA2 TaxID=1955620 RepID=UPI0009C720F8|nr:TPM domain-containing protein [Hymenobacter sp. CRA2]OON67844.1 hypothetical protein B0919_16825 [Hymenobacter sp. CRA2]